MSEAKQVKVDNWGIYFLQRLKHFFNRTDYCDLTLQFQDNAQLKVHRLVLSACTEYFELLERTCEMYNDSLVMPDDLQADVVVPIVNFMYTGQLEFKMDTLERLHATSEIMNMPVLTKLLDSHRPKNKINQNYTKRIFKHTVPAITSTIEIEAPLSAPKRTFAKAFEKNTFVYRDKKQYQAINKQGVTMNVTASGLSYRPPSPIPLEAVVKVKPQKFVAGDPRPTRYELPEELDADNIFENSFCHISYTSQPLMVHPETTKQYAKRPRQDRGQASTSRKSRSTTLDIVECKKIERESVQCFYDESESAMASDESQMFKPAFLNVVDSKAETKDSNKLFDQLLDQSDDNSAKVTIETTKNNKAGANLDHAKIISEVLKKYPHLVKSNKNIKLKIFNNSTPTKGAKKPKAQLQPLVDKSQHLGTDNHSDFTYETDVLDSKQAARLIALGAENIAGPWICLICGTPGKALHFTSYFKFRRHLVEVHNEKPVVTICEYCGQKMSKRNHLLHHLYSKHGVEPPPSHNFPKCSQCNYIALTEALLVKHKLSHSENKSFRCNVCPASFNSSNLLLAHIQTTGHKYIPDRKQSHQCIYCLRVFIRENNLYAHLKTHHKVDAVRDGIIDESDDESKDDIVKVEPAANDFEDNHMEFHIQQKPDGNIQLIQKKQAETTTHSKQKILNSDLITSEAKALPKPKVPKINHNIQAEHSQDENTFNEDGEEIVLIDNNEYIMSGNRLMLRNPAKQHSEYAVSDMIEHNKSETSSQSLSTSMDCATLLNSNENFQQASIILKDTEDLSETIPIYVSNEEEYKALMSSNHNVVYDANDENKTLTVLTTPDATTVDNTNIDLTNTQNNEMMIIHEEYPLNVSEAVATDNSNIVVVYTHQVDDPNKQYQLLTTQALGPQYAHSSAILTQNYETVSTSTPVMSAHILDSPVPTWQDTDSSAVLQSIVNAEQAQIVNDPKSIEDMSDLPEVQLPELVKFNQNENMNSVPPESELIQETEIMSEDRITEDIAIAESIPVNEEVPKEVDETEILKEADLQEIEQVPESVDNLSEAEQKQEVMDVQSTDTTENMITISSNINENTICMDVHNSDTNENIISMEVQSSDINEMETIINVESMTETVNVERNKQVATESDLSAPDGVEKSETVPSECSEDIVEIPLQDTMKSRDIEIQTNSEVEESVENIQHELKKQMFETKIPEEDVDSVDSLKHDLPAPDVVESKTAADPQVKISSLLNDWDEIDDFQEVNEMDESVSTEPINKTASSRAQSPEIKYVVPANDQKSETDVSSEITSNICNGDEETGNAVTDPETNEPLSKNENVIKQDNITSLVSDWDDDEEDNKE